MFNSGGPGPPNAKHNGRTANQTYKLLSKSPPRNPAKRSQSRPRTDQAECSQRRTRFCPLILDLQSKSHPKTELGRRPGAGCVCVCVGLPNLHAHVSLVLSVMISHAWPLCMQRLGSDWHVVQGGVAARPPGNRPLHIALSVFVCMSSSCIRSPRHGDLICHVVLR